jgi:hypothetical protein
MCSLIVDNSVKLHPKNFVGSQIVGRKGFTLQNTAVQSHLHSGHTEPGQCVTEDLIPHADWAIEIAR